LSGININARFNEFCWAAHLNLSCIAYGVSHGSVTGNPVAITPRHLITSEHGHAFTGNEVAFLGFQDRYANPTDVHVYRIVDQLTSVRENGIYDITLRPDGGENLGGFRVYYIDPALPAHIPVSIILPADVPQHEPIGAPRVLEPDKGMPMLTVDQFWLCHMQGLLNYDSLTGTGGLSNVARIPGIQGDHTWEGILWRQLFSGDSGSPLFLMHRNEELLYFGSATQGASAVTTQKIYPNIVQACEILNERNALRFGTLYHYLPNAVFHTVRRPLRPGFFRPPPSGPLG
jgi:hypothetical protein